MRKKALKKFDYDGVDPEMRDGLRGAAGRIRARMRASVVDVGCELLQVKEHLERGQFSAWVKGECHLHLRTAERLMKAAAIVGESDKLSYLPPDGLLALASRSAPETVVGAILERINAGEKPTAAEIKREIAAAKRQLTEPDPNSGCRDLGRDAASGGCEGEPFGEQSPEQQFDALMRPWKNAGHLARQRFLERIGAHVGPRAVTVASPVRSDGIVAPVHHPEPADKPVQCPPATEAADNLIGLPSRQPATALIVRPDDQIPPSADAETAAVCEEDRDDRSPRSRTPSEAHPVDPVAESWAGREPPPEIDCAARDRRCRYSACSQEQRCQHARPLTAAA